MLIEDIIVGDSKSWITHNRSMILQLNDITVQSIWLTIHDLATAFFSTASTSFFNEKWDTEWIVIEKQNPNNQGGKNKRDCEVNI